MTEKARLLAENARYREKFVRWQYNAYKRGVTEHDLEEPLPEGRPGTVHVGMKQGLRDLD